MYKITKILNNNIVCSIDEDDKEIIIRGLGIGFQKKINDNISNDKIEKIYRISNSNTSSKLQQLLSEIPVEYVNTCSDIIEYAKQNLKKRLNDNIYLTLTDHISFAIKRKEENLEYKNVLLFDIKRFYAHEYEIGVKALEIIKKNLNIELSSDEAGFIALHIVNAELDMDMGNMFNITKLIQGVLQITEIYYNIKLDEDSLDYERFVTHLKFFGQRLFENKVIKDDDITFQKMIKKRYNNDYQCAVKIREYIEVTYGRRITEEEMIFLTVHLRRVTSK